MNDTAIILSTGKFREYDMWVRFLGRETGIVTAFAFGASKSRRRFAGCLDIFNTVNIKLSYSKNGEFTQLVETTLLAGSDFRSNWHTQGIAMNCLKFLEAINVAPDTFHETFDFLQDFLIFLATTKLPTQFMPPLFRFKLACLQGYAPNIDFCLRCGNSVNADTFFAIDEGGVVCQNCFRQFKSENSALNLNMSCETLDLLQKVQQTASTQWQNLIISPDMARQYGKIIDAFVQYHLNLEWQNNKFARI